MKLTTLNYIHDVLKENYKKKREEMDQLTARKYDNSEYVHYAWALEQATRALEEFEKNEW